MAEYINWNGKIIDKNKFYISPDNRSFRYGDGFFETMKCNQLQVCLHELHFDRFFQSMKLLQFTIPPNYTASYFLQQIQQLLLKNKHLQWSRIRLMIVRGDGGIFDAENNFANYVIQTWPLSNYANDLNSAGLCIDVYKDAVKSCDLFSSIKSNNYLSYLMAAMWAKNNLLNEAILLNATGGVADTTTANLFIVSNGIIKTPPITEGGINGVYRKHLMERCIADSIPFAETPLYEDDLLEASEIFLTNAVKGIRWVGSFAGKTNYGNEVARYLHNK